MHRICPCRSRVFGVRERNQTDPQPELSDAENMTLTLQPGPAVVLDIETYGRKPNSIILSIGAVGIDFRTHVVTQGMHVNMDPEECEFYGLEREPETVRWWNNSSPEARKRTFDPTTRVDLKVALQQLTDYIYARCGKGRTYEVYSCGTDFDISILCNAYLAVGMTVPWPFWAVRDFRTLREWFPMVAAPVKNKVVHDALEDATYEAHHLLAIWKHVHGTSKKQQTVDMSTDDEL